MDNKKLFARGRLKTGEMNHTERAYARYLDQYIKTGQIAAYWFESYKLKIARPRCSYLPDFAVLTSDGELQFHEVKGSRRIIQDDALVKIKVAASTYPHRFFLCIPSGGSWDISEVAP